MHDTRTIMAKAKSYYEVSNFGNETKLGTSAFQQENKQIYDDGGKSVASGMKKINEVTQSSQFGNRTQFGQSGFQKLNAQITAKTAHAASAYSSFTPKPSAGVDVGM